MISEKDKTELKQKIQQELVEFDDKIKKLEAVTQPISPDNALGRITRMDAINNKAVNDAQLIKTNERKAKLENALNSINNEDFGICLKCKKPIPLPRLLYLPESKVCVPCASH
jgi:DnaK suppressor protein